MWCLLIVVQSVIIAEDKSLQTSYPKATCTCCLMFFHLLLLFYESRLHLTVTSRIRFFFYKVHGLFKKFCQWIKSILELSEVVSQPSKTSCDGINRNHLHGKSFISQCLRWYYSAVSHWLWFRFENGSVVFVRKTSAKCLVPLCLCINFWKYFILHVGKKEDCVDPMWSNK